MRINDQASIYQSIFEFIGQFAGISAKFGFYRPIFYYIGQISGYIGRSTKTVKYRALPQPGSLRTAQTQNKKAGRSQLFSHYRLFISSINILLTIGGFACPLVAFMI